VSVSGLSQEKQTFKKKGNKMRSFSILFTSAVFLGAVCIVSAHAQDVMKTARVGTMKVELHVLAAEPFFTADEMKARDAKEGMLIVSGAEPLAPDAQSHPNHHLVVHIFDSKTGKAVTNAKVTMGFQALDAKGKPSGASTDVPVVVMQAIGKGEQSTHYGNNVVMQAGQYSVAVDINGKNVKFKVTVSGASSGSMNGMDMR
jgi:hypothetical protein